LIIAKCQEAINSSFSIFKMKIGVFLADDPRPDPYGTFTLYITEYSPKEAAERGRLFCDENFNPLTEDHYECLYTPTLVTME
jgi:hypothetical protein